MYISHKCNFINLTLSPKAWVFHLVVGPLSMYASNQKGQWITFREWKVYPEEFNKKRDLDGLQTFSTSEKCSEWYITKAFYTPSFLSFFLSLSHSPILTFPMPPLLISWALVFNCKRLKEHSRTVARRGSFINIYMHMKQANSKLSVSSWTQQPHCVHIYAGTSVCGGYASVYSILYVCVFPTVPVFMCVPFWP